MRLRYQSYMSKRDSLRFCPCFLREYAQSADAKRSVTISDDFDRSKSCCITQREDSSVTVASHSVSNPRIRLCAVASRVTARIVALRSTRNRDQNPSCSYPSKMTIEAKAHVGMEADNAALGDCSVENRIE